jgi:O-antigen ligase
MNQQVSFGDSLNGSSRTLRPSNGNVLWIGVIALLVTTVTFAHVRNTQVGFDKFSLPKELSFQVLTLMACAKLLTGRKDQYAISRSWARWPSFFLSAFVVWSVISWLAVATNSWEASRAVGLSASMLMLWLLVGASGERDMLTIVVITVTVLSCAGIVSILDALGILPGLSLPHRGPGGVYGNRNYASHVFVLTLPACWYLYRRARRTQQVVWISVATALVIAPIVFGRSRGAWLGVVAAFIAGILAATSVLRERRAKPHGHQEIRALRVGTIVFGVVCGVVGGQMIAARLWVSAVHPLAETASHIADVTSGSGHDRLVQYSTTLRIIREYPILGVGPGNWNMAYARYASNDDRSYDRRAMDPVNRFASSDLLDLAAERGLIGLGLLLAAFASAWLATLRATRLGLAGFSKADNPPTNLATHTTEMSISRTATDDVHHASDKLIALTALFGAYIVMGGVDSLLVQAPAAVVIAIFAGAWAKNRVESFHGSHIGGKTLPRVLLVLPLALLLLTASRVARSLFAVVMYSSHASLADLNTLTVVAPGEYGLHVVVATRAAKVGDCRLMRNQIGKADLLFPFRPLSPVFRSKCLRDSTPTFRSAR